MDTAAAIPLTAFTGKASPDLHCRMTSLPAVNVFTRDAVFPFFRGDPFSMSILDTTLASVYLEFSYAESIHSILKMTGLVPSEQQAIYCSVEFEEGYNA